MQIESLKEKMTGLAQTEIVFTSPMQRCRESAQILFPDREKIEIPEWKEMNFGAFEGKNYEQLNGNPQYQAWIDSNGTLPFPEGESRAEFIDRVCAGMENAADYLRNYAQSNMCRDCGSDREVTVAAVVHGGTIMALLSHYGGGDYYDYQVENALLNKALGGDTTAQIFWLKNRRPDKWRDKPSGDKSAEEHIGVIEIGAVKPAGKDG